MTRQQVTFLIAGFVAGIITVAVGTVSPTVLAIGVGPLFFLAILAAIMLTDSWSHLSRGLWRYVAAICLCTAVYVLALVTFSIVGGYSPKLLGASESGDIVQFRIDVWAGLLVAVLVASAGIESVAYILTGKWSNSFFGRLALAGFVSVVVTFMANLVAHHYWSFLGVLLPIGEGLFCALVGAQIWKTVQGQTLAEAHPRS
ncbi:MAG TPA: hypothetical protein VI685_13380 [Candidatus Angelobacter sp.]